MKHIQNITKMKNNIQLEYDDLEGERQFGRPARNTIVFRAESFDSFTNTLVETGFTTVSDKVFDALQKERNFQYAISEKAHWLAVHDELPDFAQTPNDVMAKLRAENENLRQRLAEFEEAAGVVTVDEYELVKKELDSTKAANTTLVEEKENLTKVVDEQAGKITQLEADIVTLKEKKAGK